MPLGGVGDDLAQVVLGVEAAVRPLVPQRRGAVAEFGARPPGPDLGEPRVAPDLHPPALVVRQVQVQDVQFVRGHQVELAQDGVLGQEVPGDVEQHAAPGEAGGVLDAQVRQALPGRRAHGGPPEGVGAEELAQGLGAPEDAGRVTAPDLNAPGGDDVQPVGLGAQRVVQDQPHTARGVRRAGPQRQAQGGAEGGPQPALGRLGAGGRPQGRGVVQIQPAPHRALDGARRRKEGRCKLRNVGFALHNGRLGRPGAAHKRSRPLAGTRPNSPGTRKPPGRVHAPRGPCRRTVEPDAGPGTGPEDAGQLLPLPSPPWPSLPPAPMDS